MSRHDPAAMRTDPRIPDADGFYEALLAAHEGLADEESNDLNARLVLQLANQVAEQEVLLACIAEARRGAGAADLP